MRTPRICGAGPLARRRRNLSQGRRPAGHGRGRQDGRVQARFCGGRARGPNAPAQSPVWPR
eukprot:6804389-Lingulodinium_polyedra.AAC.1